MKRANIDSKIIQSLKKAFKILFFSGLTKSHALTKIEQELELCPEIQHLVNFIKTSKRGVCGSLVSDEWPQDQDDDFSVLPQDSLKSGLPRIKDTTDYVSGYIES